MPTIPKLSGYRFGPFTLDLRSGELSRGGARMRLQEKPRSLLLALAERPGEVIARGELRERMWPDNTYGDFEDGLNTAMRKLREALRDDSQSPRYIETVRGRGYRFVADVEPLAGAADALPAAETAQAEETPSGPVLLELTARDEAAAAAGERARFARPAPFAAFLLGCACAGLAGLAWYWLAHGRPVLSFAAHDSVLVADFDNQTGDPRFDRALETALTVSLEQSRKFDLYSKLQMQGTLRLMKRDPGEPITAAVAREICQRENLHVLLLPGVTRTGGRYRLTAQLVDPGSGAAVRSYSAAAADEDHVLSALDAVSTEIRHDLGESHYEIQRSHQPLPKVTTGSLPALEDYVQGAEAFGKGQAEEAEQFYKRAIAADPGFAMAHAALGYEYYSFYSNQPALGEKEFQLALALAARTTEREHRQIEMRYAESQGRLQEALELYRAYLQSYPDDWSARYSHARLLRLSGEAQQAVPIYRQLIRQQPDDAGTWVELATAYRQLGELQPAIAAYHQAFSLEPARMLVSNINREYGFTLAAAGQLRAASAAFSAELVDTAQRPQGLRSLAYLAMYRGQYADARRRLAEALAETRDPFGQARIRFAMAVAAAGTGDREEEIRQLDQAAPVLDGGSQKVMYGALVGQAYARAGAVKKAEAILQKLARVANDRVTSDAAFLSLLKAEVAAASGDRQQALEYIAPPGGNDNSVPALYEREAVAHLDSALGRNSEAILLYEQFIRAGSLGWEPQLYLDAAWVALARSYEAAGDRAGAARCADALLNRLREGEANLPASRAARRVIAEVGQPVAAR